MYILIYNRIISGFFILHKNIIQKYTADSRPNQEVKKWIFLKLSENVLQLIQGYPAKKNLRQKGTVIDLIGT